MAKRLGSAFETWLERKIEVLKAEGILRSKLLNLSTRLTLVSEETENDEAVPPITHNHLQYSTLSRINQRHSFTEMNYFPEYRDDPRSPEVPQTGSPEETNFEDSPLDSTLNSDYYKFVWQVRSAKDGHVTPSFLRSLIEIGIQISG